MFKLAIAAAGMWIFAAGHSNLCAYEMFTKGDDKISIGPFATSNWRSDDYEGESRREWNATAEVFVFQWNTKAGNQIGSLGLDYGSSYLQDEAWQGVKLSDIRPDCRMSTQAEWSPANGGWFFWSIYGWTHRAYTYWGSPDAPQGHENEFYIVFYTQETRETMLSQPGCVAIGTIDVDGMTFDCYKRPQALFTQWFAVCRTKEWNPSPSVHLKPVFDHWCSQGLDSNQFVTSLSWALEGFGGSAGLLKLTRIAIPRLAPAP